MLFMREGHRDYLGFSDTVQNKLYHLNVCRHEKICSSVSYINR